MQWLHCAATWFGNNADAINSAATIAAVLVAVFGFGFTVLQLRETRKALQASNTYAIQKDGRDLADDVFKDEGFINYVSGLKTKNSPTSAELYAAKVKLGKLFNFYLSVFRQYKVNGVTKSLVSSMGSDFAQFLEKDIVQKFYQEKRRRGEYGAEHEEMVSLWCPRLAVKLNAQPIDDASGGGR